MRKVAKLKEFLVTSDPYFFYPILTTVFTALIILALFLFNYGRLPARLPLFYSYPWGEKELVQKLQFMILPFVAISITLINVLFAWHINNSYFILKRILLLSIILSNIVILITGLQILTLFL